MTYTIDDVRDGDVVTYEIGTPRTAGYVQRTVTIDNTVYNREDRIARGALNDRIILNGARIIDVQRPGIPAHAGALVLTDTGLAVCDGGTGHEWAYVHTRNPGSGEWGAEPDDDAEEALPVPADPLRALLEAWDEMVIGWQAWWRDSRGENHGQEVQRRVAAFIESTRAEWERAGITP